MDDTVRLSAYSEGVCDLKLPNTKSVSRIKILTIWKDDLKAEQSRLDCLHMSIANDPAIGLEKFTKAKGAGWIYLPGIDTSLR